MDKKKKYGVTMTVEATVFVEVMAKDSEEACDLASNIPNAEFAKQMMETADVVNFEASLEE